MQFPDLATLIVRMPPLLLALTVHEYMHAYTAWKCGDRTAYDQGRVTLNPLAHLDLFGTLMLMFGPIGWAKPVPINPYNFRYPKRDDILVSLAGVGANFIMAIVFCLVARWLVNHDYFGSNDPRMVALLRMVAVGAIINYGLMVFNLLPIAPLDGHHVVRELLPSPARERFMEFSRYGPFLLLGLVLLGGGAGLQFIYAPIEPFVKFFAGPDGSALIWYYYGLR